MLFEAVGRDIAKNNSLELFQDYRDIYTRGFFTAGLESSYSSSDVQSSETSPTARSVAAHSTNVNFGLKLVLWRDDILRPGGLSNANQHQIASNMLNAKSSSLSAFLITTGNEVLNIRRDFGTGNTVNALLVRPAANGGTTAFEWTDIGNNILGIWGFWTGF